MTNPTLPRDFNIYVAGHSGMVGSAIVRKLEAEGYRWIVTRTHAELDLIDQHAVKRFFQSAKIDAVFLAAARVGGIQANNRYRADFIYQNLMIQCNVIHAAFEAGVERLLFLGSSCIYPRDCPQPMKEEYLLTGSLEPTNEPYAVAKIAGIKLCESYNRQHGTKCRAVMPTNLYGPHDSFDLESSHVFPAMLRKFHLAKLAGQGEWEAIRRDEDRFGAIPHEVRRALPKVALWGTGSAKREFLHVDDMASACFFVMQLSDSEYERACGNGEVSHLNVGCGKDESIRELAEDVGNAVGFMKDITWDSSHPDGMPRKLLDVSRMAQLGWKPQIALFDGIFSVYEWYQSCVSGTVAKTFN
jgi:GDP-L-fucose synthase